MESFRFFYHYLGSSVFFALIASMFVAVLDAIGLALFIPLLQGVSKTGDAQNADSMGRLSVILDLFEWVGIPLTTIYILLVMVSFFTFKGLITFVAQFYRVIMQQRFTNRIRHQLMKLLSGYNYQSFSGADSGQIQNTFSGEIGRVTLAYRTYFVMLQFAIMASVYVLMALYFNPKFTLMVAIGGAATNLLFSRLYRRTKVASANLTTRMNNFQGLLIQSVKSFKFLKATNLVERYRGKVNSEIVKIEQEQRSIGTMDAISTALREPLVIGIIAGAMVLQIHWFGASVASLMISLLLLYRSLTSLVSIQSNYNQYLGVSGSLTNMKSFIADLKEGQEVIFDKKYQGIGEGIRLTNLWYKYDDRLVLKNINLTIPVKSSFGIVGGSGSGKTTLANIIGGLLQPPDGTVFIGGIDLNQIERSGYRNKIGYVTQEPTVFSDTIANNVTFWEPPSPMRDKRLRSALVLAHAAEFVQQLPNGEETIIGINGVNLSGGQRQRLSIARELYRDVDLLILDEATSALDSGSESMIQQNIDSLAGQYTMIIIAHRLSTLRNVDQILYLQEDGGFEIGTFNELQSRSAQFRRLVAAQVIGA